MTTTYDTELNSDTVAAPAVSEPTESLYACYDDPDTYTISAAWASSPLGEPDDEISDSFEAIEAVDEPKPPTSRAALAAALAAGIIGGATLGAVLFGYADPGQPSFVVPWGAVKTSPSQEIATPSSPPAPPKPAGTGSRAEACRAGASAETRCVRAEDKSGSRSGTGRSGHAARQRTTGDRRRLHSAAPAAGRLAGAACSGATGPGAAEI